MRAMQYHSFVAMTQQKQVCAPELTYWHCRREYNRRVKEVVETSWMEEPDADDK